MVSDILIWNKETNFIKINEGTGDNLLKEDIAVGYVDYIVVEGAAYDGTDLVKSYEPFEGGFLYLYKLYQEMFNTAEEVIQYLIDADFIPDVDYVILYAE